MSSGATRAISAALWALAVACAAPGAASGGAATAEQWASEPVRFSNRDWLVRHEGAGGPHGDGFSADAVRVLGSGALELELLQEGERWLGAELSTPVAATSLRVELELSGELSALDPRGRFSAFLRSRDSRQLGFELGWGPAGPAGVFTLEPPESPGHRLGLDLPASRSTFVVVDLRPAHVDARVEVDDGREWRWTVRSSAVPAVPDARLHLRYTVDEPRGDGSRPEGVPDGGVAEAPGEELPEARVVVRRVRLSPLGR